MWNKHVNVSVFMEITANVEFRKILSWIELDLVISFQLMIQN